MKRALILTLIPLVCALLALGVGHIYISPVDVLLGLGHLIAPETFPANQDTSMVIINIRLPRVLAAMCIGAAISVAGAAYQGLFQNPLMSPDLLGASHGAGFGASLAILLGFNIFGIQSTAFVFGMSAVGLVCLIGSRVRSNPLLGFLLTGVLVWSLFNAATSYLKFAADTYDKLPSLTFWLMGSLATITYQDLLIILAPLGVGFVGLLFMRWPLNVMTTGEENAKALGINTGVIRFLTIACATMLTAASVCIAGIIMWVGLLVPHIVRSLVGPNFRDLIPASISIGAVFLLVVDTLARTMSLLEIPLGVLTSFVCAPFFFYLMMRDKARF